MRRLESDRATLLVGEALEGLLTLEPGSVDAIIADPPYSSGGMFRGDRQKTPLEKYVREGVERIDFDGDTRDQHGFWFWESLWLAKCRELTPTGSLAMVFTDWRQIAPTIGALQAGGWIYRGIFVWDKTDSARPVPGRLANQCEFVVWGSNGNLPLDRDAETLHGCRSIRSPRERVHMTQKPLDLMRYLVRACRRGGTILDPFAGSGTTGVAALLEGFRFIGCESNQEIAELAWKRLTGVPAQVGSDTLELFA